MSHVYHDMLLARNAYNCVECGKCVALCPMAETARPFSRNTSPRGVVQQALQGVTVKGMHALTHCLQCRSCTNACPAGVDVAGLIADLRQSLDGWQMVSCVACGAPLLPDTAVRYLERATRADYEASLAYTGLCPDCKRRTYVRNNR
ncbi:MAG: (Fe-S)-binding protein [Desulfovibrio sp.]|nr:(Fe-S)-binding protein [Desulfovibrio sp.]